MDYENTNFSVKEIPLNELEYLKLSEAEIENYIKLGEYCCLRSVLIINNLNGEVISPIGFHLKSMEEIVTNHSLYHLHPEYVKTRAYIFQLEHIKTVKSLSNDSDFTVPICSSCQIYIKKKE